MSSNDIVGRYIPKHDDRIFEMREHAQANDLRNRTVAPDVEPFDTSVLDKAPYQVSVYDDLAELRANLAAEDGGTALAEAVHCVKSGCFNIITIADRWGICSECRRKGF